MMATLWPARSKLVASSEPTRPQPTTMTCMALNRTRRPTGCPTIATATNNLSPCLDLTFWCGKNYLAAGPSHGERPHQVGARDAQGHVPPHQGGCLGPPPWPG